eukprot:CAMPEP_0201488158 /NCGR_PEP_ID=MMETSP0151_2-20130828/17334_1 /ASSEMBLY_ACC=CAM_ASM_000257 /TAXON_ID=200890 /ORGANISM="Paramoeba atlantica, Strain 621/1 / CCAP 1560/9" /LENGTH=179 /DNA_ID=CAMNT_0047873393 /DNA_START=107 /DNA_END=642 /DNA_ORIENTATION=+
MAAREEDIFWERIGADMIQNEDKKTIVYSTEFPSSQAARANLGIAVSESQSLSWEICLKPTKEWKNYPQCGMVYESYDDYSHYPRKIFVPADLRILPINSPDHFGKRGEGEREFRFVFSVVSEKGKGSFQIVAEGESLKEKITKTEDIQRSEKIFPYCCLSKGWTATISFPSQLELKPA